jgi:anti-sigma regulatory factor (Ser/Thr protein kinase)
MKTNGTVSPLVTESAAFGRLAAGAAYELAPPLSRALVNLHVFLSGQPLAADHGDVALIRRALASVEQIAATVNGLRAFTTAEDALHGVDVHEAIEIAIAFTRREVSSRATLLRRYAPVRRVRGSLARVAHAVVNLLANAAASIAPSAPGDNAIEIATCVAPDGGVTIEVTDSGLGIAADDLPFIFDPFFGTKADDKSAGLGLAVTRAAVLEMGGSIAVESTPGRGSRFRVTLASAESDDCPVLPAFDREARPERRVLCVAETTTDALLLGEIVEDADAQVLFATWGDAIDRLALGETYDLIVCDRAGAGRKAFQERLAHAAPNAVHKTFALALRSNPSGAFARVRGDGRAVGAGRR